MVRRDFRSVKFLSNGKVCGVRVADIDSEQTHEAKNSKQDYVNHYRTNKKKMAEKKEGATMICSACDATLTCRMSNYRHPYINKLQWQNSDGSAHYSYNSGKFTCTGTKQERKNLTKAIQEQDEMLREADLSKGEQK